MRTYKICLLSVVVLFSIYYLIALAVAEETLSVGLSVSKIHERVVALVSKRYSLEGHEAKNEEARMAHTTAFFFAADPVLKTPQILVTVGVQQLIAPGSKAGPYIAVSFGAVPRLKVEDALDPNRLLKFCNQWNLSPYPVRLVVVDGNLTILSVVVIEPGVALSATQIQREFTRVLQSVPRIMLELRRNALI